MRLSLTLHLLLVCSTFSEDIYLESLEAKNEDHQKLTYSAQHTEDFYPGLLGFKLMATKDSLVNVIGKRMIAYGSPESYEFFYADFLKGFNCGDLVRNSNIPDALCYANDIDFTWEWCSYDDYECNFNGSALFRYGEGINYYYLIKNNSFQCNKNNLGDPSPGKIKHCGMYVQKWTQCALEYGVCDAGPEAKLVRYGAKGKYFIKEISNKINCNNFTWTDPIRTNKVCEIFPFKYIWVECAKGKTMCRFFGITIVRFQSDNRKDAFYKEGALEIECEEGKICSYARYN